MKHIEAAIAANRFGLGARPGEIQAIAQDPQAWLVEQFSPPVLNSNNADI